MSNNKTIWLDTETTGLDYKIHGLREVAFLIEIDGVIVEEGLLYIDTMTYKNEKYISKYVRDIMGISEVVLNSYPNSYSQLIEFENILHKYVTLNDIDKFQMAGFNIEFDYGFIKEWFYDALGLTNTFNTYFGYHKLDVLELTRHFKYLNLFETKNNKLETLCKHFSIEIDAHQALSDIQATKKLHELLVERFIKQTHGELE